MKKLLIITLLVSAGCQEPTSPTFSTRVSLRAPLQPNPTELTAELLVAGKPLTDTTFTGDTIDIEGVYDGDETSGDITLVIRVTDLILLTATEPNMQLTSSQSVSFGPGDFVADDSDNDGVSNWTELHYGCDAGHIDGCDWLQVSAGGAHTCGLRSGDIRVEFRRLPGLYCWGDNRYGQLGNEIAELETGAVGAEQEVLPPSAAHWVQVSAGGDHTCAVDSLGALYCWGRNDEGQLGLGHANPVANPLEVPPQGPGLHPWRMVSAGARHTCAINDDGRLYCWGDNSDDRLALVSNADATLPTEVLEPDGGDDEGWTWVEAGPLDTCGLQNNLLFCWGTNAHGQLDGSVVAVSSPFQITGSYVDVAVGAGHLCVRSAAGSASCWGANDQFQLGDTGNHPQPPGQEFTTEDFHRLYAGYDHTCSVNQDASPGTVLKCWGNDSHGRLGVEANGGQAALVPLPELGVVLDVSPGRLHTCARTETGLFCWGSNNHGQLGNGQVGLKREPTQLGTDPWVGVAAGGQHTCGWKAGVVICWGDNGAGQLGYGDQVSQQVITGNINGGMTLPTMVVAGEIHTCALHDTSQLSCWGGNGYNQLGFSGGTTTVATEVVIPYIPGDWENLTAGQHHTCAEISGTAGTDDGPHCWGSNGGNQVGSDNTEAVVLSPSLAFSAWRPNVNQLAAGFSHTCARTGTVLDCWGTLEGVSASGHIDIDLSADGNWSTHAGGEGFHCGVSGNGNPHCWGYNDRGQVGVDSGGEIVDAPQMVTGLPGTAPSSLAAGTAHACVMASTGIYCWGANERGQLGVPSLGDFSETAHEANPGDWDNSNASPLAAGGAHTCAIKPPPDETLWCWGDNEHGQLGTADAWFADPQEITAP